MRARLVVAVGVAAMPAEERHARRTGEEQHAEIIGDEAADWAAAYASALAKVRPEDLVLAVFKDDG